MSVTRGSQSPSRATVTDVCLVGLGPANLALAIALKDVGIDVIVLEKQPSFTWHKEALLPGTRMQVHFLKDLVTPRDPAHPLTFVSYLHEVGAFESFVNAAHTTSTREQFHEYLCWAAAAIKDVCTFGRTVTSIARCTDSDLWTVRSELDGAAAGHGDVGPYEVRARVVVLGVGSEPHMPGGVAKSRRVLHSANASQLSALQDHIDGPIGVLGAGQSAAEILLMLLRGHNGTSDLEHYFHPYGMMRADDNPFANELFDRMGAEVVFGAEDSVRSAWRRAHANTNYGVVDADTLQQLYDTIYHHRLAGGERYTAWRGSTLNAVEEDDGHVDLLLEDHSGHRVRRRVSLLVCATGYRPADLRPLLSDPSLRLSWADDAPVLTAHFEAVDALGRPIENLLIHGAHAEPSHGLGVGLLSNIATRAGTMASRISTLLQRGREARC